ncbi:MAG TPA: M20 family metallopeptidase [Acidimicrobiales bacterium]|nr:M20 family metallopeptidase [Acidimicrobiales bacterium]
MDLDAVKQRMAEEIDRRADLLLDVSHRIHADPELNFEEKHAHDLLCDVLDREGVPAERHAHGLDTAFEARAGSTGPNIAVCLEYDALPGIGHACGHNIIAAAGLGAGLAAAAVADACGGRVTIVGTPAEEGGGGKVLQVRAGAFADVDAAMMVHPAGADLRSMDAIAIHRCAVSFRGESAHAAAAPEKGRNALDAAVLAYVNVAALRQHIGPAERLHGVFTDGGDKPNIVPSRAAMEWYVRSPTVAGLEALKERFAACVHAGAAAAGCEVELDWLEPPYADMVDIDAIIDAYAANAAVLGREVLDPAAVGGVVGSTDMGNVSYEVPSIHPMIQAADPGVAIHTEAFEGFAGGPLGDRAVIDGAKAMAWTIADLWLRSDLLDAARAEHRRRLAEAG